MLALREDRKHLCLRLRVELTDTGSTTSTLADLVSHRSPAVEYGIHAERSSSVK